MDARQPIEHNATYPISTTTTGVARNTVDPTDAAPSKITGYSDKMMGSIKQGVGAVFSESLREKGMVQSAQGEAELEANRAAHDAKAAMEKTAGLHNQVVGEVIGDDNLRAHGLDQRSMGETRAKNYGSQ